MAQQSETNSIPTSKLGPETNLPLPRFVSMKASEGRVRRGPGTNYRIEWIFKKRGIPLEIVAEYEHWRRVRIWDGVVGWMHYSLLSGVRTVFILEERVEMRVSPNEESPVRAIAMGGVIARLGKCKLDWCRISADGHSGWVLKSSFWGAYRHEIRE